MINRRFWTAISFASLFALLMSSVAFAAVAATSGDAVEISAPASVKQGYSESNNDIIVFMEQQNFELTRNVYAGITQPGTYNRLRHLTTGRIPEGTLVNTYMLHTDPVDRPYGKVEFNGSVEFEEEILGIVVSYLGLRPTDNSLGANDTSYARWRLSRGVELFYGIADEVVWTGNTVTVHFETSRSIDQIRIITRANGDVPTNPSVAITESPDSQTVVSGEDATFDITVTNNGDVDLTDVAVSDPMAQNCDLTIGALAVGASVSYVCTQTTGASDFTNTADTSGTAPDGTVVSDSDTADVTVEIPTSADDCDAVSTGLVGCWLFDEGSGSTAADSIGINDGTLGVVPDSGPAWVSGASGNAGDFALDFDGVNDIVRLVGSGNSALDVIGDEVTISASVFIFALPEGNGQPSGSRIVSKLDAYEAIYRNGAGELNTVRSHITTPRLVTGDNVFTPNAWNHVAITYNGNTETIYVNGVVEISRALTGNLASSTNDLAFGAPSGAPVANQMLRGQMDNVRVYGRGLTLTEVGTLASNASTGGDCTSVSSGLLGCWLFNEGSGKTLTDSVGTNDGTLGAVSDPGPTWATGATGNAGDFALDFDGTNDIVRLVGSGNGALDVTGDQITVAASVYIVGSPDGDGQSSGSRILSKLDAYEVVYRNNGGSEINTVRSHLATPRLVTGDNLFIQNAWNHVAVTYDGATETIYINGVSRATRAITGNLASSANDVAFGAPSGGPLVNQMFRGTVDNVRIYDRGLSQTEIDSLIALTTP